ncbi:MULTISPECIES: YdeI/OmpD-associated family protein [unclassified Myroides]|uniref:YdeI/OmpD-associated family protein n=1 Tax=unclassified Myroides TaxID=2642485 RepID=UPI003D2F9184
MKWDAELKLIEELFQSMDLDVREQWGTTIYYHNQEMVVAAGGFKNYFSIWFYKGVFLQDTQQKLINAQEGKTKGLRQWRFTSAQELDLELIRQYTEEAMAIAKQKRELPPNTSPLIIDALFATALEEDPLLLEKFQALAPYKQKEYYAYFAEAKREATKQSRIAKAIPLILQGKGLNDKYKK